MRKLIAKTAALMVSVSLVAVSIMPALADTATNDTTGAGSENTTSVQNINNVTVTNVSDAYIKNEVTSYANTGDNWASKNTMGGMIQTGDAVSSVEILNSANINTNLIDLGRNGGENTAGSSITGAESINKANILNHNIVDVLNNNTAVLLNKVRADSNTGGNFANSNTDGNGGMVQTGDASSLVGVSNRANDSATSVSGLNNFGSNVVGNSITGFNSLNVANVQNLNDVSVRNVSDAFVMNKVRAYANSGENHASRNTMGGMIQTGDAGVGIELLTDANINTTSVDAALGGFESTSGNSITGAESINRTDLMNHNGIIVKNLNNLGGDRDDWGVTNIDFDTANTGGNWANANTLPAGIASGIASVGKYIRVCLNDTLTSIGALLP